MKNNPKFTACYMVCMTKGRGCLQFCQLHILLLLELMQNIILSHSDTHSLLIRNLNFR